ncbi:S26 family signal peptidase [Negadavirga shengliensis]|uniref:S26 family signal peptidase n=1 Tax=Negadavirga shengliensis TaxID=1389218 RepID=A0ABV9T5A9_9BACT
MTYLVKRCVVLPGDVLEIRDRQVYINQHKMNNPAGVKLLYEVVTYEVVTEYPLQPHPLPCPFSRPNS